MIRLKTALRGTIAAGAALALLSLGACAGQGSNSGGDASGDTGTITLNFWHGMTGPDGPAVQQVIDDFNKSQSDIVVKSNVMPWDQLYQKLLTSLSGNDGPQIVGMDSSRVPQYAQKGAIQTTDDFYSGTDYMDTSVLAKAAVDASKYDGKNYGVPLNIAPMMLYWNKDLFSAAGLDPETPPATWDEFKTMAAKIGVDGNGDGKPDVYPIALADHETVPMYPPFLWNNGGGVVSEDGKKSIVDSAESLDALTYWTDLVKNNQISPIGLGGADADKLFQTGKAAMEIVGPWMTTGFEESGINFGLARPFAGPSGQTTLANSVSMTVSSKASEAQKKAAYEFFAYWESKDSQVTWSNGSGFPPNRTDVSADELTNKYAASFGDKDLLDSAQIFLPGVVSAADITDNIFNPALQKVLNGEGSVQDVFTQASKNIQADLDKN